MISQIFVLGGVLTTVLLPASDARSLADGKKSIAAVDKTWTAQDTGVQVLSTAEVDFFPSASERASEARSRTAARTTPSTSIIW